MGNNLKRRAVALCGAVVFFLTGCSPKGNSSKEVELGNLDAINALIDEVQFENDDKTYSGENIKIFVSFDPTLSAYRYNVLQKTDKVEQNQPINDIIDLSFGDDIPYEILPKMYNDAKLETTIYESISSDNTKASVTTISSTSEGYDSYSEMISVVTENDSEEYLAQSTYIAIEKDGELISDKE